VSGFGDSGMRFGGDGSSIGEPALPGGIPLRRRIIP